MANIFSFRGERLVCCFLSPFTHNNCFERGWRWREMSKFLIFGLRAKYIGGRGLIVFFGLLFGYCLID